MAQQSFLWDTTTGIGDGAAEYSRADWSKIDKVLAGMSAPEGVVPDLLNRMLATVIGANTVRVQTGGALVDGRPYHTDTNVDINIPSAIGAGNTRIDRIVLRANWAAQTVRLFRIAGVDATTPSLPALVKTSGTTYDVPLYKTTVNTAGVVTITDERLYGNPMMASRQGGDPQHWDVGGTTNYAITGAFMQMGSSHVPAGWDGNFTVTFPEVFGFRPIVILTPDNNTQGLSLNAITTVAGFTAYALTGTEFDGGFAWVAYGPRP